MTVLQTDSWQGVVEFAAVVEKRSFTSAARVLGVSVAHVSRQIQRLEDRLGVSLLRRSTRKMLMTEAGKRYYEDCRPLLESLAMANEGAVEGAADPRGMIRITSGGMFVAQEVAPFIVSFMQLYPEVGVELDFTPRVVNLIEEGYDLAIRFGALEDSALIARRLTARRLVVCASPQYLAEHGTPTQPQMLSRHQCLVGNTPTWRFRFPEGVREIRVGGRLRCGNPVVLAAAATRGLGLIYVPSFYVRSQLHNGELVTVLEDFVARDKGTWLVYPRNRFLSTATRLLIDYLLENLRDVEVVADTQ